MLASTSENSSLRKNGFALKTSALAQIASPRTLRLCSAVLLRRIELDVVRQGIPVALDPVQRHAKLRARHRIDGHQRRMRKAFVQVLDDDARVVQHQISIHQRRHAVIGIQVEQIFGQSRSGRH